MMNYAGLRAEQEKFRKQGIYRGLGFASFVEVTNPSAAFYGSAARASRHRTVRPCGSTRPARSSATPASANRARVPKP